MRLKYEPGSKCAGNTAAIERFVAKRVGMYGETDLEVLEFRDEGFRVWGLGFRV